MSNWDKGSYEVTAEQLAPVALMRYLLFEGSPV